MFSYQEAFSRNFGWVTRSEQELLRKKRIAIAGLGGVGGYHLLALTRLGVGAFTLAEFDRFEIANFNRQAGASIITIGQRKLDVMAGQARDINPELNIRTFPEGITSANVDAFLDDADLYVDGLDFFAFDARELVFAACERKGIPATTIAPLGMGASLINFLPGKMSFEAYFGMRGHNDADRALRFFVGLSPAMLQSAYLVDRTAVDFHAKRGPSTPMACFLCAGVMGAEALKILLQRGHLYNAPWVIHFDAYRNQLKKSFRPGGHRNPLQQATRAIARRFIAKQAQPSAIGRNHVTEGKVMQVLERARWAPSGDNTQPWRFEVKGDRRFAIHGFDTRGHCVYDLDGHASQISIGALIETIRIASSELGMRAMVTRRRHVPDERPTFDIELVEDATVAADVLLDVIEKRTVNRRALSTRRIAAHDRQIIAQAVGDDFELVWFESFAQKLAMTKLLFATAKLRLTMREAYLVHSAVFDWGTAFSESKIPDQAVGLDPLTLKLMRWVMSDWKRVVFFNRYLGGTITPRLQLDVVPGMLCGAHVAVIAKGAPLAMDDYLAAGGAVQRLWLSATRCGIQHQPAITPLIFAQYARSARRFSEQPEMAPAAQGLAVRMDRLLGPDRSRRAVWMGRLGYGQPSTARSLRLPLEKLLVNPEQVTAPSQG
ncbi:MAG: ThiF family adenylyltransferase [Burkholderiales bacterium]